MDGLELASLNRARAALEMMANTRPADNRANVRKFYRVAKALAIGDRAELSELRDEVRTKDASAVTNGEIGNLAGPYSTAFIESVAQYSIFDQLAKYAKVLPGSCQRAMVASGYSADIVNEGVPKPISNITLNFGSLEARKVAAIVIATRELLNGNPQAEQLFERELAKAVTHANNVAVLDLLINTSTFDISATGDALADLRAALALTAASDGYVVAVSTGYGIDLATRPENVGGMGIRGGTFAPGIEIVVVDGLFDPNAAYAMVAIPASKLAMRDFGMSLHSSGEADVTFAATPTTPSNMVSLFQTNSCGILAERSFDLVPGDCEVITVGAGT